VTAAERAYPSATELPPTARIAGWLADGTAHFAPVGQLALDGDRACCHLCGNWYLSVGSHLRVHGWTKDEYVAAFGLERGNPLAGPATAKRRAAALIARSVTEPAVQQAQLRARDRARSGELAALARTANTARPHPPERRGKTLAALARVRPEARAAGTARHARRQLREQGAEIAARFGFAELRDYVRDRRRRGLSLAAMSREAGVHKDWFSRHLPALAPEVDGPGAGRPATVDAAWQSIVAALGFDTLGAYLACRHVEQHRTVTAIAREAGRSRAAVVAAMARHGVAVTAHSRSRRTGEEREERAARLLGADSLGAHVDARRSAGASWALLAAECGLPASTLRRRNARPRSVG
jgi:lambda repressor-like predicted transcriptional regulator